MSEPIKLLKQEAFERLVSGGLETKTRAEVEVSSIDQESYYFISDAVGDSLAVLDVNDTTSVSSPTVIVTGDGKRYKLTNLLKLITSSPYALFP